MEDVHSASYIGQSKLKKAAALMNIQYLSVVLIVFLLSATALSPLHAQDGGRPGEFLRYGIGARALGMGGAYTALSDDATAVYWNPAGLGQLDQLYFHAMNTQLFLDSNFESITLAAPLYGYPFEGSKFSFGFGYVLLKTEEFERRDADGRFINDPFDDKQTAFLFPFAYDHISSAGRISVGGRLTVFQHSLDNYNDTGTGLDIGILTQFINPPHWTGIGLLPISTLLPWRFGASLHMPSGVELLDEKEDYPSTLRLGISHSDIPLPHLPGRMVLSLEYEKVLKNSDSDYEHSEYILGGDYQLAFLEDIALSLRGGVRLNGTAINGPKYSWGFGITGGSGLLKSLPIVGGVGIEFGQNIHSELSTSNTIFISMRFFGEKENVSRITSQEILERENEDQLLRTLLQFHRDPRLASADESVVNKTVAMYADGEDLELGTGVAEELLIRADNRGDEELAGRYDDFIGGLRRVKDEFHRGLGTDIKTLEPLTKPRTGYRWFVINYDRSGDRTLQDVKSGWDNWWKRHAKKWEAKKDKLARKRNIEELHMYFISLLLAGRADEVTREIEKSDGLAARNKAFGQWDADYFKALADPNDAEALTAALAGTPTVTAEVADYVKVYLKLLHGFRTANIGSLEEVIASPLAAQFALEYLPPNPLFPDGLLIDDALLIKSCLEIRLGSGGAVTDLKGKILETMHRYPGSSAFAILRGHLHALGEAQSAEEVQKVADAIIEHYTKVLTPSGVVWSFDY